MKICITGASSGIGRALTEYLIKRNHSVWGIARRKEPLEEIKKKYPNNFFFGVCNVENNLEVLKTKRKMEKNNFFPEVIIIGAAISADDINPSFNNELYQKIFLINLFGAVNFVDIFLPDFIKKREGQFIALSSIASFRPSIRGIAYPASKSALSLTFKGLDLAYRKRKIYFSNIYLGPVRTSMWEGRDSFLVSSPEKIAESISKVIQTRRSVSYYPFLSTFLFRISRRIPDKIYALLSEYLLKSR